MPREAKPKKLDIFDILGNILCAKDWDLYNLHVHTEGFETAFSSYMILRYTTLVKDPAVANIVLNHYDTLEQLSDKPQLLYKILLRIIPKQRSSYNPYIKSSFEKR